MMTPRLCPFLARRWRRPVPGQRRLERARGVHEAAQAERQAMLDTMRDLVGIESGSKDVEGVERIAALVRDRLAALGGKAEIIQPAQVFRLDDTPEKVGPMVRAEFLGSGDKKIMLIAHMDTVYRNGMLKDQPFRIDGDKAYGLGIADDKHGVAAIIHTLALLHKLDFRGYGKITVLINGDEEISSPGARDTITALAADQDAVFSYEGGGAEARLTLATSGIGAAYLTVQGKTSHAGARGAASTRCTSWPTRCCRWTSCRSPKRLEAELDRGPGRHQPQRHPGPGHGRPTRARGRFRRAGAHAGGKVAQQALARVQGQREVRGAPPPLEATAASRAGLARRGHLPGAGPAHEGGGPRQRRHRRRLCRAEGARPGHRGHGPVRLRRPLQ